MPSGKGVRLVLITAICEGYHAPLPIDHHDNENEMLKALLVFKATRDYHQQMNSKLSNVFCN